MTLAVLALAMGTAPGPVPRTSPARREAVQGCIDDDGERGIAACRAALASTPRSGAAGLLRDLLLRKLASLGRWDEAVEVATEAAHVQPQDAAAQLRLGEVLLYGANRPQDALAPLREAIRLNPQEPRAQGSRGFALSALGRHKEALAAFEEAVRLDPQYLDDRPASRAAQEAARRGEAWP